MTPRAFYSGVHSYGAADSEERKVTSCGSWTKSGLSSCQSCPKSQRRNHSTPNGNRVDRGNENHLIPDEFRKRNSGPAFQYECRLSRWTLVRNIIDVFVSQSTFGAAESRRDEGGTVRWYNLNEEAL